MPVSWGAKKKIQSTGSRPVHSNQPPKRQSLKAIDLFNFAIACIFLLLSKFSIQLFSFETVARLYCLNLLSADAPMDLVDSRPRLPTALAIKRAARYLPGAYVCLPQALAGKLMLRSKGVASLLVLGVKIDERQAMSAHAWLVSDQAIILGGARKDFKSVAVFE